MTWNCLQILKCKNVRSPWGLIKYFPFISPSKLNQKTPYLEFMDQNKGKCLFLTRSVRTSVYPFQKARWQIN